MAHDSYDVPDSPPALGSVVEQDRGSLPFALIHGEALVACASWALGDAGVLPVDIGTEWAGLVDAEEPFVLHDALCPMTPASFIAACVTTAVELDRVVVGVRPVTDTVKHVGSGVGDGAGGGGGAEGAGGGVDDGGVVEGVAVVGATVDRASLVAVVSPIVLPASVVAALDGLPTLDFADLVAALAERFDVELVEAPAEARRVGSADDVRLLEALTGPPR